MGYRHQNPLVAHYTEADFGSAVEAESMVAEPEQVGFVALLAAEVDPNHLAAEAGPLIDPVRHLEHDHLASA